MFAMGKDWRLAIDKQDFSMYLTTNAVTATNAEGLCNMGSEESGGLASKKF